MSQSDGKSSRNNAKLGIMSSPRPPSSSERSDSGSSNRGRKPQTDGCLTQEMVTRIYVEELHKLLEAAERAGNLAECHRYRLELQRLTSNHHRQHEDNKDNVHVKSEPEEKEYNGDRSGDDVPQDLRINNQSAEGSENDEDDEEMRHSGSAFFLVRLRSTQSNGSDFPGFPATSAASTTAEGMSPLQRMQSIAKSLMIKSQLQQQQQQQPLRAVLPPVTQEDFDKHPNINTDELVKQIKENLSQFSISQRLFGENVLGLSQESVSNLLAHPKPWHMLTQKGREPFIRMKIFLEDSESIPKLVASQHRIPPDKLLRSTSVTDSTGTGTSYIGVLVFCCFCFLYVFERGLNSVPTILVTLLLQHFICT